MQIDSHSDKSVYSNGWTGLKKNQQMPLHINFGYKWDFLWLIEVENIHEQV